jgi:hypothetical protein
MASVKGAMEWPFVETMKSHDEDRRAHRRTNILASPIAEEK